jgi:hypothetical protein
VFECYLDDCGDAGRASERVVCCAGYLTHKGGRDEFNRRWRHLLLKHDLPYLRIRNWIETVESMGLDRAKRREILADFTGAIDAHDLLGFVVAVDTRVWSSIGPKRRKQFGSAGDFCFQRLMRLVLDRLEAAEYADTLAIVFDQDIGSLSRRTTAVKRLSKDDTRASYRVQTIEFSSARIASQLQAVNLLWWSAYKELNERSRDPLRSSTCLNAFSELSVTCSRLVHEFWDQAYTDRYLTSIEWHVTSEQKMKASRKPG